MQNISGADQLSADVQGVTLEILTAGVHLILALQILAVMIWTK
jgi:hypothetical protein